SAGLALVALPHDGLSPFISIATPFFLAAAPTSAISTLSLHDALPILESGFGSQRGNQNMLSSIATLAYDCRRPEFFTEQLYAARSEEHTSELQSRENLVCRLLLEKKTNVGLTSIGPCEYSANATPYNR